MSDNKKTDPFEGIKQLSDMWEKQVNGLLYMMTDNNEFVRLAKIGTESHARYMELLRKNQELMAGMMNIPTKTDIANVARLAVQAEEKIDNLEEQFWSLQDSLGTANKENLLLFQDIVSAVKQMKGDLVNVSKGMEESEKVKKDLQELRKETVKTRGIQTSLQEVRQELSVIKKMQEDVQELDKRQEDIQQMRADLMELKQGMNELVHVKSELEELKALLQKNKERELIPAGN